MASRSLSDLSESVGAAAHQFLVNCSAKGLEVLIYCTLRSGAEQRALWASGRTVPGPILTHARPGESLHNADENGKAWAFDAVPVSSDGRALWNADGLIQTMGECGEAAGMEWAGRWRGALRERVHFQIKRG